MYVKNNLYLDKLTIKSEKVILYGNESTDVYRIAICDDEPLLAQRNEALTREILTEDGLVEGRDFALEVYTAPQALL